MKHVRLLSAVLLLFCGSISQAQQFVATDTTVVIPPLVNFSSVLTDNNGRPISA